MKLKMWFAGFAAVAALHGNAFAETYNWMSQYQNFSLNQLVIPGTHDSGAYRVEELIPGLSPDASTISFLPLWLQKGVAANWAVTQNESIGRQLWRGYRYFDMRLCGYGNTVYACHGVYTAPLATMLNDIESFFKSPDTSHEVIILDFNHLTAMSSANHGLVFKELKARFGSRLAGAGFNFSSKLSDFASAGKNIIVVYNDPIRSQYQDIAHDPSLLPSPWPDQRSVTGLENFLIKSKPAVPRGGMVVTQLVLTPDKNNVISSLLPFTNEPQSLLAWANTYNSSIIAWINTSGGTAAIPPGVVIQDFAANELVDYALLRNSQISIAAATINPFNPVPKAPSPAPKVTPTSTIQQIVKAAVQELISWLLKPFFR